MQQQGVMTEKLPTETQPIDVDKVLITRNPRLYNLLPGFFLRYLKRIIHQEDLNDILTRFADVDGKEFVARVLEYMKISYELIGEENIPRKGRYIFASNHPLGGLDGMVFIDAIGKYHERVLFIVNDLLMNIKNLEPVFIPVNKHGRQSIEYARRIEEAYASDAQILYFPAGLCSRKRKGRIQDLEWKKNFLAKARQYERDIVPVHFSGRNSGFFYNLANIRAFSGIKSNIEMIYLPDEMFMQKDKRISLRVGKPISRKVFDERFSLEQWAGKLKEHVYTLEMDHNHSFPYLHSEE